MARVAHPALLVIAEPILVLEAVVVVVVAEVEGAEEGVVNRRG